MPGAATSEAEVTNISQHGFWLLLDGRELFLPFEEFPWFKRAPVEAILQLDRPQPGHLYWPALDVDLSVASIEASSADLLAEEQEVGTKLRALGPIGSEGGAMTTKKPSSPDDQSPSAPVPMDAGSARTTLHKLAARFWLHPGYIGTRTGSVVR
jgi:Protein of unknown function (DUF2442)